jgi:hypothetical protein
MVLFTGIAKAQVSVNVSIKAPAWGPPVTTERYYYMPDIETYYDVPTREYIYIDNGSWVRARNLPVIYRDYDLYRGRKVIINDYRGNAPYVFYNTHRVKYVKAYTVKHYHGKGHKHGRGRH